MISNKLREVYISQKDLVDENFNKLDDLMDSFEERLKDHTPASFYTWDIRELLLLWREFRASQYQLDNLTDAAFDVKDEE